MGIRYYPSQWGKRYHFDNIYEPTLELSMVNLYQAGEIIAGDGFEIHEHTQTCAEISYIVSGECRIYTDDRVFEAKAGDVHVICAGKQHKVVAEKEDNFRMAYIAFYIREGAMPDELTTFFESAPIRLKNDVHQMKLLFEQLLSEIYISKQFGQKIVDACVSQILVYTWRLFDLDEEQNIQRISDEIRMERIVGHTVFRALRYIDANLVEINSISQVARELGYNTSYLSKVFREKMGFTMSAYISDKKVDIAKSMLCDGCSVAEVAHKMGYASSQSFCKMFHRCTGHTPKEPVAMDSKKERS